MALFWGGSGTSALLLTDANQNTTGEREYKGYCRRPVIETKGFEDEETSVDLEQDFCQEMLRL